MHLETFLFESLLANRWRTPKRKVPCGYFHLQPCCSYMPRFPQESTRTNKRLSCSLLLSFNEGEVSVGDLDKDIFFGLS